MAPLAARPGARGHFCGKIKTVGFDLRLDGIMKKMWILAVVFFALSLLPSLGWAQSKEEAVRLHKEANA